MRAARAFWLLEYLGHPNVRVLDGGFDAWRRRGLPMSTDPVAPTPSDWHGTPDPVAARDVAATSAIVSAIPRPRSSTRGATPSTTASSVRAKRGGAIPGAVHLEWKENLTPDGRFKSADELRAMYDALGVTPDREVVTYCQGGYRAAHTYLALRRLGYPARS